MSSFMFESWTGLLRVLLVGPLAYAALVLILRVSGKRSLSKFNAFDFVVTIALGSTLATILLNRSGPLAEGVAALALLVGLQFAITWASVRSRRVSALVKSEPTLLVRHGVYVQGALRRQRVTTEEVDAAVRSAGLSGLESADPVILETGGSITVVGSSSP